MQSTVLVPDGRDQVCYLTVVRMRPHEGVSAFQIDPLGILKETRSNNRAFGPFDHIFTPSASNEDVFKDVLQPLLEGYRHGQDIIVVLLGGSGSGKSFTMQGKSHDGLAYRSLADLLNDDVSLSSTTISLYEYPYGRQGLSENAFRSGNEILSPTIYNSLPELYTAYTAGIAKRAVAATSKHDGSSRSVLELRVSGEHSTLSFFDLPGKEYASAKAGSNAHTLSKWINTGYSELESLLSLLQLGKSSEAKEGVRLGKDPSWVVERLCDGAAALGIACIDPSLGNPDELKRSRGTLALAEKFKKTKRVDPPQPKAWVTNLARRDDAHAELRQAHLELEELRIERMGYQDLNRRLEAENEDLKVSKRHLAAQLQVKDEALGLSNEKEGKSAEDSAMSVSDNLDNQHDIHILAEPFTPERPRQIPTFTYETSLLAPGPASDMSTPYSDQDLDPASIHSLSSTPVSAGLYRQLLELIAGHFLPACLQDDLQTLLKRDPSNLVLDSFLDKVSLSASEHRKMLSNYPELVIALQTLDDAYKSQSARVQHLSGEPWDLENESWFREDGLSMEEDVLPFSPLIR